MTDLYFCPRCQKVTEFTLNWVHSLDGKWYHECWECDSVLETEEKAVPFDQSDKSPSPEVKMISITQRPIDDELLELLIQREYLDFCSAKDEFDRSYHFCKMVDLQQKRSQKQITKMEEDMGLNG